ncbi:HEAT repeat domain-containing protein [Amycolatopsis sp. lyj-112]|uniref:HEAT repeat domain-containing protein n=1 Tax=Amycolatopsis sp. lyj-112 TaxID=2789288 RepID=UPI00397AB484
MPTPRNPDTPSLGPGGDNLEAGPSSSGLGSFSNSEIGELVTQAAETMAASGEDAERNYQRSLDRLRERAEEVASAVGEQYDALAEDQYLERWGMVQLLTDLRHQATVPALENVLRQPIPPERSDDPAHGISTVGEEVIIRTTAVEALARLASSGDSAAKELLLRQVRHEVFTVRRAAVQAIAESGDTDLTARVREELSGTEDEQLLNIRRVDVRGVPQAVGGRFVKDSQDDAAPPPEPPRS